MQKISFFAVTIALYAATLAAAYLKDSWMFAGLFVAVLLVSAAFYLLQFGNLSEFTFSAFSTNAKFIREKAIEVKDYSDQIRVEKERIDKASADIEELRQRLTARVEEIDIAVKTAAVIAMTGTQPI